MSIPAYRSFDTIYCCYVSRDTKGKRVPAQNVIIHFGGAATQERRLRALLYALICIGGVHVIKKARVGMPTTPTTVIPGENAASAGQRDTVETVQVKIQYHSSGVICFFF